MKVEQRFKLRSCEQLAGHAVCSQVCKKPLKSEGSCNTIHAPNHFLKMNSREVPLSLTSLSLRRDHIVPSIAQPALLHPSPLISFLCPLPCDPHEYHSSEGRGMRGRRRTGARKSTATALHERTALRVQRNRHSKQHHPD